MVSTNKLNFPRDWSIHWPEHEPKCGPSFLGSLDLVRAWTEMQTIRFWAFQIWHWGHWVVIPLNWVISDLNRVVRARSMTWTGPGPDFFRFKFNSTHVPSISLVRGRALLTRCCPMPNTRCYSRYTSFSSSSLSSSTSSLPLATHCYCCHPLLLLFPSSSSCYSPHLSLLCLLFFHAYYLLLTFPSWYGGIYWHTIYWYTRNLDLYWSHDRLV